MTQPKLQSDEPAAAPLSVVWSSGSEPPFTPEVLQAIGQLLPDYLAVRRWFRAKARSLHSVDVQDVVPLFPGTYLLVLRVKYSDGGFDHYLLPLSSAPLADDALAKAAAAEPLTIIRAVNQSDSVLYSAFANPEFRKRLLSAIAADKSFAGYGGSFHARQLTGGSGSTLETTIDSFVSRAEQSNTSVIYGDRYILKLFRKIEEGINPDLEIGAYLTKNGFAYTPAVVGLLEYRSGNESFAAGLLQRFVPNRGDAWKFTLESLADFFARALDCDMTQEAVPAAHPIERIRDTVPERTRKLIGSYLGAARLLGWRTAEMHSGLAAGQEEAFRPEAFTDRDRRALYDEMSAQADSTFALLRQKKSVLTGGSEAAALQLLAREQDLRSRFDGLLTADVQASRIRFHGDYHLGQVLYTGDDFMIIDFEGEPARPLEERRTKALALRDVAGMVRSFQYAADAALFGQVTGERLAGAPTEVTAHWSAYWFAWVSRSYLQGYFETAGDAGYLPPDDNGRRALLDLFLLHKALYEVSYELNNRPSWVRIPLRGILGLIA